jgi:hypothetical protein
MGVPVIVTIALAAIVIVVVVVLVLTPKNPEKAEPLPKKANTSDVERYLAEQAEAGVDAMRLALDDLWKAVQGDRLAHNVWLYVPTVDNFVRVTIRQGELCIERVDGDEYVGRTTGGLLQVERVRTKHRVSSVTTETVRLHVQPKRELQHHWEAEDAEMVDEPSDVVHPSYIRELSKQLTAAEYI